jgi:hypothetical protein
VESKFHDITVLKGQKATYNRYIKLNEEIKRTDPVWVNAERALLSYISDVREDFYLNNLKK